MLKRRERCDFFSAPQMEFDLDAQCWMLHGFFFGLEMDWLGCRELVSCLGSDDQ